MCPACDRQRRKEPGQGYCRICRKVVNRVQHYGLTEEAFEDRMSAQGGRCPICERALISHHPAVDHCHQTDVIRGVLCQRCNSALGKFEDSPSTLRRAIRYVQGELTEFSEIERKAA